MAEDTIPELEIFLEVLTQKMHMTFGVLTVTLTRKAVTHFQCVKCNEAYSIRLSGVKPRMKQTRVNNKPSSIKEVNENKQKQDSRVRAASAPIVKLEHLKPSSSSKYIEPAEIYLDEDLNDNQTIQEVEIDFESNEEAVVEAVEEKIETSDTDTASEDETGDHPPMEAIFYQISTGEKEAARKNPKIGGEIVTNVPKMNQKPWKPPNKEEAMLKFYNCGICGKKIKFLNDQHESLRRHMAFHARFHATEKVKF